jgi:hypothetical protein
VTTAPFSVAPSHRPSGVINHENLDVQVVKRAGEQLAERERRYDLG